MGIIPRLLLALLGLVVSAQVARRVARRVAPDLDLRLRPVSLQRAVFSPERLLPRLPLEPGMRVLVLGPATDALLSAVARAIGKYGKLYVLEASQDRAQRLQARLQGERIGGAEVLVGRASHLDLPDATFDLVLCVGVLADLPLRQRALWSIERVLRPGGHLSVSQALIGPEYLRGDTLRHEAAAVGLVWREQHGSPLAYTANFRKLG